MRFLSLFSGIEAASLAWIPLGWTCVAVAEIEPFPCALLRHHYPGIPNLGDVTKITREQIEALGHIDVAIFGFPCQDLSVAGKRAGLHDEDGNATRSGLFFTADRIVQWSGARFTVGENVPGIFSSNKGRDFAAVVGTLVGAEFGVPRDGWRNSGAAIGPRGMVEWATLDAQFFGLAQRRKRVFFVRDTGDWTRRPPILLESESVSGNPPARGAPAQRVAPTIEASIGGGRRGWSSDFLASGGFAADVAGTLTAAEKHAGSATQRDVEAGNLIAFGGNNTTGPIDVATACRAKGGSGHGDFESETFIAHTLKASDGGVDREDGHTLIPQPFMVHAAHSHAMVGDGDARVAEPSERARALDTTGGYTSGQGGTVVLEPMPFDSTQITHRGDPSPTLAKGAHPPLIAFRSKMGGNDCGVYEDGSTPTMGTECMPAIAFAQEMSEAAAGVRQAAIAYAQDLADPLIANEAKTYTHEGTGNFRTRNVQAFAFKECHYTRDKAGAPSDVVRTLSADADKGDQDNLVLVPADVESWKITCNCGHTFVGALDWPCPGCGTISSGTTSGDPVSFQPRIGRNGRGYSEDVVPALGGADAGATSDMRPCIAGRSAVRRLTPLECERLQGMPDDYTKIPIGKGFAADGPRYKGLGNSFARPVVEWIGRRIDIAVNWTGEAP